MVDSHFVQTKIQEPLTRHTTKYEYQVIEEKLKNTPEWPPKISYSTSNLADLMRLETVTSDLTVDAVTDKPSQPLRKRSRKKSRSRTESSGSTGANSGTPTKNKGGQNQVSTSNVTVDIDQANGAGDVSFTNHLYNGEITPISTPGSPENQNAHLITDLSHDPVVMDDDVMARGDSIEDTPLVSGEAPFAVDVGHISSEHTVL